jgi:hypothetical protein
MFTLAVAVFLNGQPAPTIDTKSFDKLCDCSHYLVNGMAKDVIAAVCKVTFDVKVPPTNPAQSHPRRQKQVSELTRRTHIETLG